MDEETHLLNSNSKITTYLKDKTINEDNLQNFCRTCLHSDILLIQASQKILIEINNIIGDTRINENSLPEKICMKCYSLFLNYFKFKVQVNDVYKIYEHFSNKLIPTDLINKERKNVFYPTLSQTETQIFDNSITKSKFQIHSIENKRQTFRDSLFNRIIEETDKKISNSDIKNEIEDEDCDTFDENLDIKVEIEEFGEVIQKSNRKYRKKFKSEAEEFEVIKLTKEQVLEERKIALKKDKYLKSQYKCDLCIKWFNFHDVLQMHMTKHQKTSPFECDICHQFFPSLISLRGHLKSHFIKYKCRICQVVRVSRQHLLQHYSEQHQGLPRVYVCSVCGKTSTKRTTFQKHLRMHRVSTCIPCDRCGKMFKSRESLRVHRMHHEEQLNDDKLSDTKPFICDKCPKSFRYSSLLVSHKETHSESKKYYCVECDIHFKTKTNLENHLRKSLKHVDPESLKFRCEQCLKKFLSEKCLQHHIEWFHLSRRNFKCDKCEMQFASTHGLRYHQRKVHEGLKSSLSYKCEVCGKAFSTKTLLTRHLRTHTGEKPYECSQCGRKFAQSSTMVTHIRLVHLKVKRNIGKDEVQHPAAGNNIPQYFYQASSEPVFDGS